MSYPGDEFRQAAIDSANAARQHAVDSALGARANAVSSALANSPFKSSKKSASVTSSATTTPATSTQPLSGGGVNVGDIPTVSPGGRQTMLSASLANMVIQTCNAVRKMKGVGGVKVNVSDFSIIIDGGGVTRSGSGGELFVAQLTSDDDKTGTTLSCVLDGTETAITVLKPYLLQGTPATNFGIYPPYLSGNFILVAYNADGWGDMGDALYLAIQDRELLYQYQVCASIDDVSTMLYVLMPAIPQVDPFFS